MFVIGTISFLLDNKRKTLFFVLVSLINHWKNCIIKIVLDVNLFRNQYFGKQPNFFITDLTQIIKDYLFFTELDGVLHFRIPEFITDGSRWSLVL